MRIDTRYFGEIEFEENDIINFSSGIVGFEQFNKYLLIKFEDENNAMFCLHGIGEDAPVFVVFNPFEVGSDYEPVLSDSDKLDIKCSDENNVDYYVIANIKQPMENTVINLKSPIAVNTENRLAKQIIMDKYELRYPMFKKTEE